MYVFWQYLSNRHDDCDDADGGVVMVMVLRLTLMMIKATTMTTAIQTEMFIRTLLFCFLDEKSLLSLSLSEGQNINSLCLSLYSCRDLPSFLLLLDSFFFPSPYASWPLLPFFPFPSFFPFFLPSFLPSFIHSSLPSFLPSFLPPFLSYFQRLRR